MMKIIRTAIILILTLLVIPIVASFTGEALSAEAKEILWQLIYVMVGSMAVTFLISELTANHSQVDKIWGILPIVYVAMVWWQDTSNLRLGIMFVLVLIWGARLTYNFSLKGAFKLKFWEGEEDYRWKVLKQKKEFAARWKWKSFNLFFVSGYQNVLILLFTMPALLAYEHRHVPLGWLDVVAAVLMFFFILYEAMADRQHWKFQSAKWAKINAGLPLSPDEHKGFLDKGLWAWSRHPNYFAEQMIWLCFYLFSIAASGLWLNWTLTGGALLVLLFQGSAAFIEEISISKYPEYAKYQNEVNQFIPWKNGYHS